MSAKKLATAENGQRGDLRAQSGADQGVAEPLNLMAATQSMSRKGGTIPADGSLSHERTRASNGKVPGFLQYRNSAGDASLGTGLHQTSANSLERYKAELKE
jgi:hypothetical protein